MTRIKTIGRWLTLAGTFIAELTKATLDVIRSVLFGRGRLRPAILAVPLDVRSPAGITMFADMVTLTPGTTSLHVSDDRRTLYVHALDVEDREQAVEQMKSSLEARVREVLP